MSGINVNFDVANQKGTPAFYSDIFANRPSYGYAGRVFISTDTGAIYEDTGTSWTLIADAGAGTTGTLQQVTTNGSSTTIGLSTSGNGIGIGTTIPASNRLDIHTSSGINATFNGTGTTDSALQLQSAGVGKWNIQNLYNAGANSFQVYDVLNSTARLTILNSGSLGIGTNSLTGYNLRVSKNITGAIASYGIVSDGATQSDVTTSVDYFISLASTQATAFTLSSLTHFNANQGTIGSTSAVTNQYGFAVGSSLTGATNNYGFYGNIASGTNRWNIYMNGTANNYMAGSLGIGATNLTGVNLFLSKTLTGSIDSYHINVNGVIQSDVTNSATYYRSSVSTAVASFTLGTINHYLANQGGLGAGSIVTNQYGFAVNSNLIGATNNYGFYGNIASGTNRFNLYMNGTATNYLGGILNTATRVNVNGATDNATFSLNNNGQLYTAAFSPNILAVSTTTYSILSTGTTTIYTGTGVATWTLPNPSGTNQMFWIKNAGTGIITLNAFAGTTIINNAASSVASISIAVGATALIQQDGNIKSYQLQ
jgi:hypothetical protein